MPSCPTIVRLDAKVVMRAHADTLKLRSVRTPERTAVTASSVPSNVAPALESIPPDPERVAPPENVAVLLLPELSGSGPLAVTWSKS